MYFTDMCLGTSVQSDFERPASQHSRQYASSAYLHVSDIMPKLVLRVGEGSGGRAPPAGRVINRSAHDAVTALPAAPLHYSCQRSILSAPMANVLYC